MKANDVGMLRSKRLTSLLILAATGALGLSAEAGWSNTVTFTGPNGSGATPNGSWAVVTANAPADANHNAYAFGGNGDGAPGASGGYASALAAGSYSGSFSPSTGSYSDAVGGSDNSPTGQGAAAVAIANANNSAGEAIAIGYGQGGMGLGAADGGGVAHTFVDANTIGPYVARATGVALGGIGVTGGGNSEASASALTTGASAAYAVAISTGGAGTGSDLTAPGGSGSLGNVTATSNGGYVFVEGAEIGGAGKNSPVYAGSDGAAASLTNAVTGTTTGHSELIQIAEGGAAGDGAYHYNSGTAGLGYSSLTTNSACSNAGIETYAAGGAAGSGGYASSGGVATSIADGTNTAGASGVEAFAMGGAGGHATPSYGQYRSGGMGGGAAATATSTSTLSGAAVTAIAYAAGGGAGSDIGGAADATATANLVGGYVNSYALAIGGTGIVGASPTALADAYANDAAAGAVNAQAVLTNTTTVQTFSDGQTATAQSDMSAYLGSGQLHTESSVLVNGIPAASGANVTTQIDISPAVAIVSNLLANSYRAPLNWNIYGSNPPSIVAGYDQISFLSAGASTSNVQYHSGYTMTFNYLSLSNLGTLHDLVVSFLGATSTGTGSVILQITNLANSSFLLNNSYAILPQADTAMSYSTFDLGSIASLLNSSNALNIQFNIYFYTGDANASFQTSFIVGSSTLGAGIPSSSMMPQLRTSSLLSSTRTATPEPGTLGLLALGGLGLLARRKVVAGLVYRG